jgi:predicted acyltransferase
MTATDTLPYAAPAPVADLGPSTPPPAKPGRLRSLDVFRGVAIGGMVLANNPGSWEHIYAPFEHAEWDGCTPTDCVFPFFLFAVGVAIAFALGRRRAAAEAAGHGKGVLFRKILVRSACLFLVGVALVAIPSGLAPDVYKRGIFDLGRLRALGVLHRIALCYFAAATLSLYFGWRGLLAWAVGLMALYAALMLTVPVGPGGWVGDLSIGHNLCTYVDGHVLGYHCYVKPNDKGVGQFWDPEGLLSTLSAIGTPLIGVLAGLWLRTDKPGMEKAVGLLAAGAAAAFVGYALNLALMPVNKGLWTPSFVFLTGGYALMLLGTLFYLVDLKGHHRWTAPLRVLGLNALLVFVLSALVSKALSSIPVADPAGKVVALRTLVYSHYTAHIGGSPNNASLAFAATWLLGFVGLTAVLAWLRIVWKL